MYLRVLDAFVEWDRRSTYQTQITCRPVRPSVCQNRDCQNVRWAKQLLFILFSHNFQFFVILSNREIVKIVSIVSFLNKIFVSGHAYVLRESRRDPSNRRLYEHGIGIRLCQDSNSQPVPSPRPQWPWCEVIISGMRSIFKKSYK